MKNSLSKQEKYFFLLASSFIALLVTSNVLASKVIMIKGIIGPAAVICYAITFVISDTIAELWGKERAKFIVATGFFASIISAVMIKIAIALPAAPFWNNQEEYRLILGSNFRMVLASMSAYLVSQYHDVWAFHYWKDKTKGKYLWVRNNFSTAVSQLIDTIIFITIAFYGTGTPLISLIIGQYIIKLVIAILDTPLVYFLVNVIKKSLVYTSKERTAIN